MINDKIEKITGRISMRGFGLHPEPRTTTMATRVGHFQNGRRMHCPGYAMAGGGLHCEGQQSLLNVNAGQMSANPR